SSRRATFRMEDFAIQRRSAVARFLVSGSLENARTSSSGISSLIVGKRLMTRSTTLQSFAVVGEWGGVMIPRHEPSSYLTQWPGAAAPGRPPMVGTAPLAGRRPVRPGQDQSRGRR